MNLDLTVITRKSFTLILLALIVASGCNSSEESAKTERQFLSIGTAPPGGAFFPVGSAIAKLAVRKIQIPRLQLRLSLVFLLSQ